MNTLKKSTIEDHDDAFGRAGRATNKHTKNEGQTPKSDIPPNITPKIVTPEDYLQIWDSSATLIGQLAIETLFGAILGGIPLSGPYSIKIVIIIGWLRQYLHHYYRLLSRSQVRAPSPVSRKNKTLKE